MATNGNFPISQLPLTPIAQAATQTQISGAPQIANRTITTPADGLTLTLQPGSVAVTMNLSMMGASDVLEVLSNAGISVSLDIYGQLQMPSVTSVSGNANMTHALGLS